MQLLVPLALEQRVLADMRLEPHAEALSSFAEAWLRPSTRAKTRWKRYCSKPKSITARAASVA